MFSLDTSLLGIEAAEMDVTEVYRSTMPLNLSVEGMASSPCEAFACAVTAQGGDVTDIFALLRFPSAKYSLVYRPDRKVRTQSDYTAVMKEALDFLGSMGFVLEPVNLNYSRAMREVVIRSLRVLSVPGSLVGVRHPLHEKSKKAKSAQGKTQVEVPVQEHEVLTPAEPVIDKSPPAGESSSDSAVADLREELARLNAELKALKQSHAEECAALVTSRDQATEEHNVSRQKLEEVSAELATEKKIHEEEMAALSREREQNLGMAADAHARLEHDLYESEGERERLSAELAAMEKAFAREIDEMRSELEQHAAGKETLRQTLTKECDGLQEMAHTLAAEKQALEKMLGEQLTAARNEAETLSAELATLRESQEQELAGLSAEWERLLMEKSAEHDQLSGELARSQAEIELLRTTQVSADEVTKLREQLSRAVAEKSATEKSLQQILAVVEEDEQKRAVDHAALLESHAAECARLTDELELLSSEQESQAGALAAVQTELALVVEAKSSAEQSMSRTITELEEEVELLSAEKAALAEAHAAELAGLRSRFKRTSAVSGIQDTSAACETAPAGPSVQDQSEVPVERNVVASMSSKDTTGAEESATATVEPAATMEPTAAVELATACSETVRPKRSARPMDTGEDEQFADAAASDTMFHKSGRLKGIEIGEGDTLVELHRSINTLHVSADGYPSQKSSAYICALNKGDVVRVYIALYLTESKAVQMYVTAGGKKTPPWEDALREAIIFAETVGFMMDRVELGSTPEEYDPVLAGIPVFIF